GESKGGSIDSRPFHPEDTPRVFRIPRRALRGRGSLESSVRDFRREPSPDHKRATALFSDRGSGKSPVRAPPSKEAAPLRMSLEAGRSGTLRRPERVPEAGYRWVFD